MNPKPTTIGALLQAEPTFDFDRRVHLHESDGTIEQETDHLITGSLRDAVCLLMQEDGTISAQTKLTNGLIDRLIALVPKAITQRIDEFRHREAWAFALGATPIDRAISDNGGAKPILEKYLIGLKSAEEAEGPVVQMPLRDISVGSTVLYGKPPQRCVVHADHMGKFLLPEGSDPHGSDITTVRPDYSTMLILVAFPEESDSEQQS